MPSTIRHARLLVINDNVDLGSGVSLPQGEYGGKITDTTIFLHGHPKTQVSKVSIYLSSEFLQKICIPSRPDSTLLGIEADFTPSYLKGDIIEL